MNPRISTAMIAALATATLSLPACSRKDDSAPPVATPSVTLAHDKVPLGSPIDVTYRWVVAPGAKFDEDFHAMVHVVDTDEQMIFDFDHLPPVSTKEWKPGQTIEYTRTEWMPIYPYVGEASLQLGLYSVNTHKRLPLAGENVGQRAYKVTRFQIQPQTENVLLVYKDGWHPAEQAPGSEWQWTKKDASIAFKNPKKDCVFYLDLDTPGGIFEEEQTVQVTLGGQTIDQFTLKPKERQLKKLKLTAAQLGTDDMAELHLIVDKTFVPALIRTSNDKDPRELGVRVFHAYLDAR
ncbi:MAG TPA: hypothetical protein VEU08_24850 [Vicinamibacterales bacterium]|nr:hypothetical protein [Vicinamibacterales bacterium]